jgi:hypothetical protein
MITRSIKDNSDWSDHLLPCILGYRDNLGVVVDRVIARIKASEYHDKNRVMQGDLEPPYEQLKPL